MLESTGVLVCTRDELFTDPEALASERLLGRLFRSHPRRLCARSAPVRGMGDRGRDASVRDAPGSHRSVRPRARGTWRARATSRVGWARSRC